MPPGRLLTVFTMVRSILSVVLCVLVLVPPGVCTCDGGAQVCTNHPAETHSQFPTDSDDTPHASAPAVGESHHCPDPLPHQPSCQVVSTTVRHVTPTSASTAAPELLAEPIAFWFATVTIPCLVPLLDVHWSTPPLFLTHCALLI